MNEIELARLADKVEQFTEDNGGSADDLPMLYVDLALDVNPTEAAIVNAELERRGVNTAVLAGVKSVDFKGLVVILHRNELVRITDLATTTDIIDGHEFEGCEIVGPAVLLPLDNIEFDDNSFEGDLESMLWPIAEGQTKIIGAVGLRNVAFRQCQFRRIGIAGKQQFLLQFDLGSDSSPD